MDPTERLTDLPGWSRRVGAEVLNGDRLVPAHRVHARAPTLPVLRTVEGADPGVAGRQRGRRSVVEEAHADPSQPATPCHANRATSSNARASSPSNGSTPGTSPIWRCTFRDGPPPQGNRHRDPSTPPHGQADLDPGSWTPDRARIPGQRWVSASPSGLPGGAMAVPRTPVTASLASDVPPAARPDGTLTPPAFPGENTTSGAAADAAAPVRAAPARSSSATAPAGAGPGVAPPVRSDRTSWPPPDSGASCRGAPVAGCCGSALPIAPGSPVTSWAGWKPSVFGW
jgi:hypothetical protein